MYGRSSIPWTSYMIALSRKLVPPMNVRNGDALGARGEPIRWLPYGEIPRS